MLHHSRVQQASALLSGDEFEVETEEDYLTDDTIDDHDEHHDEHDLDHSADGAMASGEGTSFSANAFGTDHAATATQTVVANGDIDHDTVGDASMTATRKASSGSMIDVDMSAEAESSA